mmetsp:Transcript_40741/g.70217  ORF Transcript_40741/g.70217 Transcript_40741/m.70217 type:complete len:285 (-) Transcript_40741:284-1138(-)
MELLEPLLLLLLAAVALGSHEDICNPIPAVMWSGSRHLSESLSHDTRTTTLGEFLREIEESYTNKVDSPEALMFIQVEGQEDSSKFLHKDNMEHAKFVKDTIEAANSAVVRPYIYPEKGMAMFDVIQSEGLFGDNLEIHRDFDKLKASAEAKKEGAAAAAGPGVLLLSCANTAQAQAAVAPANELLHALTGGNFLVVHAPSSADQACAHSVPSFHRRLGVKVRQVQRRLTTSSTRYIKITPDILSGLLLGALMVFTVILGLSCLNALQTPSSYAKVKPALGKEN